MNEQLYARIDCYMLRYNLFLQTKSIPHEHACTECTNKAIYKKHQYTLYIHLYFPFEFILGLI